MHSNVTFSPIPAVFNPVTNLYTIIFKPTETTFKTREKYRCFIYPPPLNPERNRIFATHSDSTISISLQPDGVNLWYFKLSLFDLKWLLFYPLSSNNNDGILAILDKQWKEPLTKKLSFCHKIWFSYPYIFAFQCRRL